VSGSSILFPRLVSFLDAVAKKSPIEKSSEYSLDAALNAKNKAAKKKYSLGAVETLAQELADEKPGALWQPNSPAYDPLDYYVSSRFTFSPDFARVW